MARSKRFGEVVSAPKLGSRLEWTVETEQSPWRVRATVGWYDGQMWITELSVRAVEGRVPRGGIRKRTLEAVSLRAVYAELSRTRGSDAEPGRVLDWVGMGDDFFADLVDRRRVGRRGHPEVFYAKWAALFVEKLKGGVQQRIYQALGDDHPGVPATTIHGYVQEATRRELLINRRPGIASGELSDRAMQLLAKEQER